MKKKSKSKLIAKNHRKNLHKHPGPPFQIRPGQGYFSIAGNSNGTIIFEIGIVKKSSPINWKFTFVPLSKPKIIFFWSNVNKNKPNSQNICEKVKFDKDFNWLRMTFYYISISKVVVPLEFSGFLLYVDKFGWVLAT